MERLPLKPFEEMSPTDYAEIGLKCGLEVHQQLLTETKLFCRCPAGQYTSTHDAEVLRHMRPTLSEMGEYDGTALMEKKTRKNITYRLHHATVCTYEFDDTPPFPINDEAVDIALQLAILLRLNLVNELHIARKQYLDGSIPTGFQRTTILGVDGWIPCKDHKIRIRQLGLEEDSCREVSDQGHDRVYLTDRLGMPLIEVVTEADMFTPQETAEVCNEIRKLCRSTQQVRRGYGATRQDVNVSVRGGTRIEIKGVPQIWRIPKLIYNEASRQVALLRIRDELNARSITEDTLETPNKDITQLLEKSSYVPVKNAIDKGLLVKCIKLPGFGGLMNTLTQEHTMFGKEFSDRVRVIACLTELPNIVHSDAASDSLWPQDWQKLRKRMNANDNDVLILVWGDEKDTTTACQEISIRAREATIGIPSDTRQPLKDGTNGFERVLPGADRMYPDTDLPPITVTDSRVNSARERNPEYVWDTEARFINGGMVIDDAERLCISPLAPLITYAITDLKIKPVFLGVLFSQKWRAFKRAGLQPKLLTNDAILLLLLALSSRLITREGIAWLIEILLSDLADKEEITKDDVENLLNELQMKPATEDELNTALDNAIASCSTVLFPTPMKKEKHLMGQLMRQLRGRVDGERILDILKDKLIPEIEITVAVKESVKS